jgi:hypothetical protein
MTSAQVEHHSTVPVLIVGHQFIARYYKRLGQYGDLNRDENLRRLIGDLLTERWFERCRAKWGFEPSVEAIFRSVEQRTFRGVLDAIFLDLARHNQMACRWGDKTPEYTHDLDVLGKLFPEAKYVHLVRDGRDVALSVMGRYWGPKNVFSAAHEWRESVAQIDDFFRDHPELQTLEITYEQLLRDPVDTFRELIKFLEIDNRGGALLDSLATDLQRDLMSTNFDKWRRDLSPEQRTLFERVAGDLLRRHGYETLDSIPATSEFPAWEQFYWNCDNRLRKWTYGEYWRDNWYKVRLRTRDVWRSFLRKGTSRPS